MNTTLVLRGDIERPGFGQNASMAALTPVLCAQSVIASLVVPLLAANVVLRVLLATFTSESGAARQHIRAAYSAFIPVDEVRINRTRSQRANVVAAMDAAATHPYFASADHLLLLRLDIYLKRNLALDVLPLMRRPDRTRILVAFASRQLWAPGRPNGSRPGCLHSCSPPAKCDRSTCSLCGALPGEGKCAHPRRTKPFENGINDVFFGFMNARLASASATTAQARAPAADAASRPATQWWSGAFRIAFAGSPRPGDFHAAGGALSRLACISFVLPDAYDTNTERSANPLYDILPRSYGRLMQGRCVAPSHFETLWKGAPPCCATHGHRYCPQNQGPPPPGIRVCP